MLTYSVHGSLSGQVAAPISKSELHRLLLAAALSSGSTLISYCTVSEDILATARVLQAAGAFVEFREDSIFVKGIFSSDLQQNFSSPVSCDCSESGSTLRFLIPVFSALGIPAVFSGKGRLAQRPMQPLLDELSAHGAAFSLPRDGLFLPLGISQKLQSGVFSFSGNISSQYITGLLFALPLLRRDSKIIFTSPLESKGYVDMSIDTLSKFGIRINPIQNGWEIPGNQQYRTPGHITARGDWSNAAFWICAGALCPGPQITVTGTDPHSFQGDKAVCGVLKQMGAKLTITETGVTVQHSQLSGTVIDASQIPDIIPILSVAAAVARGKTKIIHASRLRIKESDRLHAMYDCLSKIGAEVTELEDGLIIRGKPSLTGGRVSSFGDHRIAMSMAVASLVCKQPVEIEQPLCVSKSYPDFYRAFQSLGGIVDVINLGQTD